MARTPIWKTIADALTAELAEGLYGPGDKLPTEAQLAARFAVNRHTVRHALAALAEAGLVHARRGAGVFVAQRPTDYPLGRRVRFAQNLRAAGRSPDRTILSLDTRPARAREAEALALPQGAQVHVMEGLSLADAQPLAVFRSVFPAVLLPDLPDALRAHPSVTMALSLCGIDDYTRASTRITAKRANGTQARLLQIAEGAPILRSVAVNVDPDGQPVEYGTTWFAGDRVTLTLDDPAAGAT